MVESRSFTPATPQPKSRPKPGGGESRPRAAHAADERPLGEGAPAGLDIHNLGQPDRPQDDWGDPADEGAVFSANHTRRSVKTEADRGQGRKTRAARKDQVSRRL